jgi:3'-5' exoribonuclease
MAIEHTAVCQLRGRSFGPPLVKSIYMPMYITSKEKRTREDHMAMGSKQLIRDIKPGDKIDSYFSVAYKKPVTDYKYGAMFETRGADRSGQITLKYWGGEDKKSVQQIHDSFDKGDVVKVVGEASDYRGQLEISISEKNKGVLVKLGEGSYDLDQLIDKLENIDEMKVRVLSLMDQVEEPFMKQLLESFFRDERFMAEFALAPASIQLHSAAFGGLLQHTLNVVDVCMKAAELHPELDRDLVLTGALLHDIGKVRSFTVTTHINQTHEGNLVGHIILGDQELMGHIADIKDFPEDISSKLRHVLLSHHGKKEWGSPVEPMMPEALTVHMADDLDAKLDYMIARRRDAVTEDDWIWDGRLGRLIYLR